MKTNTYSNKNIKPIKDVKKTMLVIALMAGLAGGSRSLADIITPVAITPSIPQGWSLQSAPPGNLNTLPAATGDVALFWHPLTGWTSAYTFISPDWYDLNFNPTVLNLGPREGFSYVNSAGSDLHNYIFSDPFLNSPPVPPAPWLLKPSTSAPWSSGAPSVSPTGLPYYHLLGWSGLECGTFERIIDHLPHFHQYAIIQRYNPGTATYRPYTFANGRWFPEAPVLNAGEAAFFQFGPGTGPSTSVQLSGVTLEGATYGPMAIQKDPLVAVILTGRFPPNNTPPTIQLRKSYDPNKGTILSPLPLSTKVSADKRVLRAKFDFSAADVGDYDVLMDWSASGQDDLPKGIRIVDSSIYHMVEGSTLLGSTPLGNTVNYEVTFPNITSSTTVDVRFYATSVSQSYPNVQIQNLLHFLNPQSVQPGNISATLGTGGSGWKYEKVLVSAGGTLTVPVTVNSAAVAPYLPSHLPLRFPLEVSWRVSATSTTTAGPWSDPVWMPSFIIP